MKRILLLDTSIASLNMGDEIIKYSIQANFPEIFQNNYIYNLPTHTQTFSPFQLIGRKDIVNQYISANYTFLCGTNALLTNMFHRNPTWNINLWNSSIISNVICLGVGHSVNSKKTNWYTKRLYHKVLSSQFIHSVRDEPTKLFLEELGLKAYNTGCPTLWGMTPERCKKIPKQKAESVVFTLTNYSANIEQDKLMVKTLLENYENVYFWPQSILDRDYLDFILPNMNVQSVGPNIFQYQEILSTDIDYVGNRLHGGIFALQHGRRAIIVSIDHRAENMSKSFNLPILKREDMSNLSFLINSTWDTSISGLDFTLIKAWKSQFIYD